MRDGCTTACQLGELRVCDSAAPTLEFHLICAEMEKLCSFECRIQSLRTSKGIWTVIVVAIVGG